MKSSRCSSRRIPLPPRCWSAVEAAAGVALGYYLVFGWSGRGVRVGSCRVTPAEMMYSADGGGGGAAGGGEGVVAAVVADED